jgi:hypothetical protein
MKNFYMVQKKGFRLIAGAAVQTYLTLNVVMVRNATERSINHAAQVSLERISRDIHSATTVDILQSSFGTTTSTLALIHGTTTTTFSVASSTLSLSINGALVGPLTGDDVAVVGFVVDRFVGTTTELIRVALTLHSDAKVATTTRTYYVAGVLRGSYE